MEPRVRNWNPLEHYKKTAVAEAYDKTRFRGLAGRLFNAMEKREIGRAFSGAPADSHIVDVPCGTGRLAEVLLEHGFKVHGVDISPEMLKVAAKRLDRFGQQFSTEVCDARLLAQSGRRFDGALCARVLMHFPLDEQIEFLKGVVAATSGRVVFTQGLSTPYQRLRRRLKRLMGFQNPAAFPLTAEDLAVLLSQSGLRALKIRRLAPLISESMIVIAEPVT